MAETQARTGEEGAACGREGFGYEVGRCPEAAEQEQGVGKLFILVSLRTPHPDTIYYMTTRTTPTSHSMALYVQYPYLGVLCP